MKKIIYIITMIAAVFMIYSCEGPEGDAGPRGNTGDTGAEGETGLPGEDGSDGLDGSGIYEMDGAYDYGYIAVAVEGIRPATIPFEDSVVFDMILPNYLAIADMSIMYYDSDKDSSRFNLYRINREIKILGAKIGASMSFDYNDGEVKIRNVSLLYPYKTETGDFYLYTNLGEDTGSDIPPGNISGYSYDSSTGALKLQYEVIVPAEDNSTNRELKLKFYVNTTVLKAQD